MSLVERDLLYVSGTIKLGLKYPRSSKTLIPRSISVHVDADWSVCKDALRLTTAVDSGGSIDPITA